MTKSICFPFSVRRSVWLNKYSTFRIGGPANYFKEIRSLNEAQEVISFLHRCAYPYIIVGRGSNCLFDDRGFDGFVVFNNIQGQEFLSDTTVKVFSGMSFSHLGKTLSSAGYSGLEFAVGIPGSVGGAIYMNAGACHQEISHVLREVEIINSTGDVVRLTPDQLQFSYRQSRFQSHKEFILSATFNISKNPDAQKVAKDILQRRLSSQPYQYHSAGCIFRNPKEGPAGRLIEEAGLKGLSSGDAQVSTKHANFIINKGRATAQDIKTLIQKIREKMHAQGIHLEEEIRIIPYRLDETKNE